MSTIETAESSVLHPIFVITNGVIKKNNGITKRFAYNIVEVSIIFLI